MYVTQDGHFVPERVCGFSESLVSECGADGAPAAIPFTRDEYQSSVSMKGDPVVALRLASFLQDDALEDHYVREIRRSPSHVIARLPCDMLVTLLPTHVVLRPSVYDHLSMETRKTLTGRTRRSSGASWDETCRREAVAIRARVCHNCSKTTGRVIRRKCRMCRGLRDVPLMRRYPMVRQAMEQLELPVDRCAEYAKTLLSFGVKSSPRTIANSVARWFYCETYTRIPNLLDTLVCEAREYAAAVYPNSPVGLMCALHALHGELSVFDLRELLMERTELPSRWPWIKRTPDVL